MTASSNDAPLDLPSRVPRRQDLRAARERIAGRTHRTPLFSCSAINGIVGGDLFFKCENFQKGGAFKIRGALNHLFSLTEEEVRRGVVTHSSGNHAQALAMAARARGVPAHIVMPETAPRVKIAAVRGYGAEITFCAATEEARTATAARIMEETGAHFVHPYNDPLIVAGQGTATMEILDQVENPDMIVTPVGGGGLLSGSALAARYFGSSRLSVWGAEPELASDAHQSLREGQIVPALPPRTIADGLLTSLGDVTFEIIQAAVEGIGLCSEGGIARAMRLVWERMKLLVEPSGAVPLAAILERTIDVRGKRVVVILSGGNVDLARIPELLALEDNPPGAVS
ncbi:MAG: pyridoxal-phosphate dependent enzyme [Spirochaetaceae bacterium]|nr:MAG: pyridoxal-phosphate dependent enzyme [Spirochaetaceae bacterium]